MKLSRAKFIYSCYWLQTKCPKARHLYESFRSKAEIEDSWALCFESSPDIYTAILEGSEVQLAKIESLLESDLKFIALGEDLYPEHFQTLEIPPLVISYWGEAVWKKRSLISVVGSREPTVDSLNWIEQELVPYLSFNKVGVVSGGARGIDQAAHRAALLAGEPTVVLVPAGLGRLYPKDLTRLKEMVLASGGAFVSEYPYQQEMKMSFFEARNRLIASLGRYLLVVEGKRRSGSLLTAQLAINQGKDVAALPGHPLHPQFSGTLELLISGAHLVRDRLDLMGLGN